MSTLGQIALLTAFVGSGYAAFAGLAGWNRRERLIALSGEGAGILGVAAITPALAILLWALVTKDFSFAYVAEYSHRLLPWYYSASALWVGQAGSLLLWAWLSGCTALAFRFWPGRNAALLRRPAFAVLMANLCFLLAVMVFSADPMQPSLGTPRDGAGLTPSLQHPAMLIHPPIVFLGYAGWSVPFALAVAALLAGRADQAWIREARRWALFAWAVLGGGILVGALWAYEELGWGGYWAWDPVENGSLIPWLTGTTLLHTLMVWQYRGALKKATLCLAIGTFGLCNLAAFLTRSGVFSSLHAFSESPIGWMFLVLMAALTLCGGTLMVWRRRAFRPDKPLPTIWAREAVVVIAAFALLILAAAALAGTLAVPLSKLVLPRPIVFGPAFYHSALIPTGLLLLGGTAAAPLLRWGRVPRRGQRRALLAALGLSAVSVAPMLAGGIRHPIVLSVAALALLAVLCLAAALLLEAGRRPGRVFPAVARTLLSRRREYAGYLAHMGLVCLAVGVTGSSLGSRRCEVVMRPGETIEWAGRSIRFIGLEGRERPDKLVMEARLEVEALLARPALLRPAQHKHRLQQQWTDEVAIHSTWGSDLYSVLRGGEEDGSVRLTLVENPLMRWMWFGGWVMGAAVLLRFWPRRHRPLPATSGSSGAQKPATPTTIPGPHWKPGARQPQRVEG